MTAIDRRGFLRMTSATLTHAVIPAPSWPSHSPRLSVTMDDFSALDDIRITLSERTARILSALRHHRANAMGLVIGRFAETPEGSSVLSAWSAAGHTIGNHTFSHLDYHAAAVSPAAFIDDFKRADTTLRKRQGFRPFFRFPMLHGGDTVGKRDAMRSVLRQYRYREAHVTIDTADWLIDHELRARLAGDPDCDTRPYRDLYLRHMRAFAIFFREAAGEVFGRDIPHTLLTHFNLLNALYLHDVLDALRSDGWSFVAPVDAYRDDVFRRSPRVLPAGDSLVWTCARETGRKLPTPPVEDQQWLTRELERLRS